KKRFFKRLSLELGFPLTKKMLKRIFHQTPPKKENFKKRKLQKKKIQKEKGFKKKKSLKER
ncbi:hypothetical protein, partial [Helicobacter pylori]|uniref:hypothetical protein n=1 Tax=Helicobacter pylori TaxID=210 RepID=UPI001C5B4B2E